MLALDIVARRRDTARRRAACVVGGMALALVLSGCAALSSLTALSQVRFDLAGVTRVHLAGVDLTSVRGYQELSAVQIARVGLAITQRELPLELTLDLRADNPDGNPDASLLGLDWTLFLEDRRTVSGALSEGARLPSGAVTPIPVSVRLDLLDFFEGSARDLVNLAAGLAGVGGDPVALRLEAIPTIETPIGPIRYPRPLVLGAAVGG